MGDTQRTSTKSRPCTAVILFNLTESKKKSQQFIVFSHLSLTFYAYLQYFSEWSIQRGSVLKPLYGENNSSLSL